MLGGFPATKHRMAARPFISRRTRFEHGFPGDLSLLFEVEFPGDRHGDDPVYPVGPDLEFVVWVADADHLRSLLVPLEEAGVRQAFPGSTQGGCVLNHPQEWPPSWNTSRPEGRVSVWLWTKVAHGRGVRWLERRSSGRKGQGAVHDFSSDIHEEAVVGPGVGTEHVDGGPGIDSHLRHDHAGRLMERVVFA